MIEERRLPDARLAPNYENLALAGSHVREEPIEGVALVESAAERWDGDARRHRH
jgi:hypothetical protein